MADGYGREVTKITLTAAALQRLLGGDSDLEVTFRQHAAEAFAHKHLKALVNDDNFSKLANAHAEGLKAEIDRMIGQYVHRSGGRYAPAIRGEVQKLITEATAVTIRDEIAKRYNELATEHETRVAVPRMDRWEMKIIDVVKARVDQIMGELSARIDNRIDTYLERRVQEEVQKRLERAAALSPSILDKGSV